MKYRIRFLRSARSDLKACEAYLLQYSEEAAGDFYAELDKILYSMQTMPFMFQVYERLPRYRRFIVGKYSVYYVVDEEKKQIGIYRVLHNARDANRHLKV